MKVPARSSEVASCHCALVFITIGAVPDNGLASVRHPGLRLDILACGPDLPPRDNSRTYPLLIQHHRPTACGRQLLLVMKLQNAMKNQPPRFHSGEAHSLETHARARSTLIDMYDLIGRQGHSEPILEDDERTRWAVLDNRQALGEVPFSIQARSGNELDQQRDLVSEVQRGSAWHV